MDPTDRPFSPRSSLIVACDWNGTLLDDAQRVWDAARLTLARRGLPQPGREEFFGRWRLPLRDLFRDLGIEPANVAPAVDEWNEEVGLREAKLAPGALAVLRSLRDAGVAVGVVSAIAPRVLENDLERVGLAAQLDFVVGGAEPKRRVLAALAQHESARVVYVGDTEYDMVEARAAGAWAIGFGAGYRPAAALLRAGAHEVIDRLDLLPEIVSRLDGHGPPPGGAPR